MVFSLMSKDNVVLNIDTNNESFEVVNADLLPISLQTKNLKVEDILGYMRKRTHILTEENQKILDKIYEEKHPQMTKQEFCARTFQYTSMTDSFWMKPKNNINLKWELVNPRTHELKDINIFFQFAELVEQHKYVQPQELKDGSCPKMWEHKDGESWLYKLGSKEELTVEMIANTVLNKTNIPHVNYESSSKIRNACKCKNLANDDYSLISAGEVRAACNRNKINYDDLINDLDKNGMANMNIINYLILNSDASDTNIYFYQDIETGNLTGLAPMLDYNNAFNKDIDNKKMHDLKLKAYEFLNDCTLKFSSIPTLSDFQMDYNLYKGFMERGCHLGIFDKVLEKKLFKAIEKYVINERFLENDKDIDIEEEIAEKQFSIRNNCIVEINMEYENNSSESFQKFLNAIEIPKEFERKKEERLVDISI